MLSPMNSMANVVKSRKTNMVLRASDCIYTRFLFNESSSSPALRRKWTMLY